MNPDLASLAKKWGVATSYVDGIGVERAPSEATVSAVLRALGAFDTNDPAGARDLPGAEGAAGARNLAGSAGPVDQSARAETTPTSTRPAAATPEVRRATRTVVRGPHGDRAWGLFAPLAGLRSAADPTAPLGNLSLLADLAANVSGLGGSVIGTLPLVACPAGEPSPYSPVSRRHWDDRWVDPLWVDKRLGLAVDEAAVLAVESRRAAEAVGEHLCDPAAAGALVRARLALRAPAGLRHREVLTWRSEHPEVERFAEWRAAQPGGRDPEFEVFAQWAVTAQLEELGRQCRQRRQSLYLDIPVGVACDGFDVLDEPELFVQGVSIGAPADAFFPGGQVWGLAPLHPRASQRTGHRYLREVLDHHMSVAGLIRLDHVMGLHRQFWVPEDGDGDGTYVSFPADELWDLVAERSAHFGCGVVGEDLGTVPDSVREAMAEREVLGLFIGQDEIRAPFRLSRPIPKRSVAALNTHDLPPVAQWWQGDAESETESVRDHLIAEMGVSSAEVVLVSEADLSLDTRRLNEPGTVGGATWRLVSHLTVEDFAAGSQTSATRVLERLGRWRSTARGDWPEGSTPLLDHGDLATFDGGLHARIAERFGVHPFVVDGMCGAAVSVWAPRAKEVQIAGDFDGFSGTGLRSVGYGIWSGFVPGAAEGDLYKFKIRGADGQWREKADPLARSAELPPGNASRIVASTIPDHVWTDHDWLRGRAEHPALDGPMSIYEVQLGSWRLRPDGSAYSYRELAQLLGDYVKEMGFTHVELMPVLEHPFGGSWGYHVTGYFAPTARYGDPEDFAAFVNELHARGIGVILDWVPAHFPTDPFGLVEFDGEPLYEYGDPRVGFHPEWGSLVFDWGRPQVRSFLVSSARWWLERFHIDGLRVDAVASMIHRNYARNDGEWVPNVHGGVENLEALDFVRQLTTEIHRWVPGALVIAEESTSFPAVTGPTERGGLGFDLKWDLGWMHDTLDYLERDAVYRKWHHNEVTFRSMYADSERFVLPLSHDEVVHGKASLAYKMAGDRWQQLANLRLLFGYQYTVPGVPLIFMGGEFAQSNEWDHNQSLSWDLLEFEEHQGVQRWVQHLNALVVDTPALYEQRFVASGFEWLEADDAEHSVFAWLRWSAEGDPLLLLAGFTPVEQPQYQVGLPVPGTWRLVANSDDRVFGGSGYPVPESVDADQGTHHRWRHSGQFVVPPLGLVAYRKERE